MTTLPSAISLNVKDVFNTVININIFNLVNICEHFLSFLHKRKEPLTVKRANGKK